MRFTKEIDIYFQWMRFRLFSVHIFLKIHYVCVRVHQRENKDFRIYVQL